MRSSSLGWSLRRTKGFGTLAMPTREPNASLSSHAERDAVLWVHLLPGGPEGDANGDDLDADGFARCREDVLDRRPREGGCRSAVRAEPAVAARALPVGRNA